MTPLEAEITKYCHNVFGAYKVTYFNAVYDYCRKMGADWARVHAGMLLSGYINGNWNKLYNTNMNKHLAREIAEITMKYTGKSVRMTVPAMPRLCRPPTIRIR